MRCFSRAFSLIELLVVVAIVGILSALSITAIQGIRSGRALHQAGDLVLDQLALARQSALSRNARVRWMLISVPDNRNNDPAGFRRMQSEIFDAGARAWKPLGRSVVLPMAVVADPTRSNLITNAADGATNSVVFLASGRTRLDPSTGHWLTLSEARNTNNFIAIQIDPVSGRCRTFQP